MSFVSKTFVSNAGWDLIQNNNRLRYQKGLKEKEVQLHGPPAFKSQRYRVGHKPNKKLLHQYQHAKKPAQFINSILKYSRLQGLVS